MSTATVYHFNEYDLEAHLMVRSSRMATLNAIEKRKGKAIKATAQEVDESRLDVKGFLVEAKQ